MTHAQTRDFADIGLWLRVDANGTVREASGAWPGAHGLPPTGAHVESLFAPVSRILWATTLWPALLRAGRLDEVSLELAAGKVQVLTHWRPVSANAASSGGAQGGGWQGWMLPGAERRRLVSELERARRSLALMPAAVLQLRLVEGAEVAVDWASDRLLDLLGLTPMQAQSNPKAFGEALEPASFDALVQSLAAPAAPSIQRWTTLLVPRHAPNVRLELSAWHEGHTCHGVLVDVTERERLQRALRDQARTDALTQLPNRVAVLEALSERLEHGQPLAVLFADCDRFKEINDSLGHAAGDELLQQLAQRLRHGLRAGDLIARAEGSLAAPMAARLGGDEFLLVAPGVADAAAAQAVANRLIAMAAQPYCLRGQIHVTSISVGIVLARPGDDAPTLLRNADIAMYEAKHLGRGRAVVYVPVMHEQATQRLALEAELREALGQGGLRAVYQPIIDIETGRVVGLEALARWRHAGRGEVSPAQFVPLAEACGLAPQLGIYMLERVCRHVKAWRTAGVPTPARVSVNLSRAQLTQPDLVERVVQTVAEAGLEPQALQFEVTESLAMDDTASLDAMQALRAEGFQLSLDDFGTGYSSLSTLTVFPIKQIKIDKSFVQALGNSAFHRVLVQAVVQIASVIELEVIAEGVETREQAEVLVGLGCKKAQGWLYSKALEADDAAWYLARASPA